MRARDIRVEPIATADASRLIRAGHYSHKTSAHPQLSLGVFDPAGRLAGAMQFGPPLDRRKMLGLVRGAPFESVLELARMWFAETLPRNSESRALGVAMRMLRQHAPQVRWVVSFADAAQCGDGTIYRAAGFVLTAIKSNKSLVRLPDGTVTHQIAVAKTPNRPRAELGGRSYFQITGGRFRFSDYIAATGAEVLPGYQFRYIRFLDPSWAGRLTVPVIPFSDIPADARMYRGQRVGPSEEPPGPPGERRCKPDPDAPPGGSDASG